MGGSGGGSAGEVSWPDDVQNRYNDLLGNMDGGGFVNLENALGSAQGTTGYDIGAYDGSDEITEIQDAYTKYGDYITGLSPVGYWQDTLLDARDRYLEIIGVQPTIIDPDPVAAEVLLNAWILVEPTLHAIEWTKDGWEDPDLDAPDDIKEDMAAADQIDNAVATYAARLDDQITSEILPKFQAGMRDINAVQSSAFSIGEAIIYGMRNRDVANFDAELTYKAFLQRDNLLGQAHMQIDKLNAMNTDGKNKSLVQTYLEHQKIVAAEVSDGNKLRSQAYIQADKILADAAKANSLINAEMARHGTAMVYQDADSYFKHVESYLDLYKAWAAFIIDANRIIYVMGKEERDKDIEYEVLGDRWDLDMVQIAGNLIASISGGTSYTPGPSPAQNALGGAFAGASIGARASGSAWGAGAGAVLGGIGAYLMGR